MEDFIQPPKKQKKQNKNKAFKEGIIIVVIVVSLALGFTAGYLTKGSKVVNSQQTSDSLIDEAYQIIKNQWYNTNDQDKDIDVLTIKALVAALDDPHSSYLTVEEADEFNQSVNGDYEGIGVGFTSVENGIMLIRVYDNSPAEKSGLQVGDIITHADGESLAEKSTDDIKELIRGKKGTEVALQGMREDKEISVMVTRDALDTSVQYDIRESNGVQFGYLEITTFGMSTATEVEKALAYFAENKVKTIVMDLRDNGGGYVTAAKDILNCFIEEGKILYQMQGISGPAEVTYAEDTDKYSFSQGYVLMNGSSASASELVAAALQEHLGYQLVGTQSYGKGTAQKQTQLSDGSTLKITYAKWLTPNGNNIHGEGLTPDVLVENANLSDILVNELEEEYEYNQVNEMIASMQHMLSILGYDVDRTDGYFSQQTKTALEQFEEDKGLTVDGTYSNKDHLMLIGYTKIFINDKANDKQYDKLLSIIK